jgi:hypothetical protein
MWNLVLRTRGMYVAHDTLLGGTCLSAAGILGNTASDDNGSSASEKPDLRAGPRNLRARYVIVNVVAAQKKIAPGRTRHGRWEV